MTSTLGGSILVPRNIGHSQLPARPLPPIPKHPPLVQQTGVNACPVRIMTCQQEQNTYKLVTGFADLSLQHTYNQSLLKHLAEKSKQYDSEIERSDAIIKTATLVENENHRKAIAKLLALLFAIEPEGLITSLSMEDAQKFEFNAKQQVFAMNTEASAETVVALLKNRKLTTLDLSVFTSISDQAWEKLCKGLPETNVNKIIFSKNLVPAKGESRDKQFKVALALIKCRNQAIQVSTLKE